MTKEKLSREASFESIEGSKKESYLKKHSRIFFLSEG
jgi:hypothetical protein